MSGSVVNLQDQVTDLQLLAFLQGVVDGGSGRISQSKSFRLDGQAIVQFLVFRVKIDRNIPFFFHQSHSADMIDVGVCIDDGDQLNVVLLNSLKQLGSLLTGINKNSLESFGTV
jgi:hypothetical protein